MKLEEESEDVHELLKSHEIEFSTEELQQLYEEQQQTLADDLLSDISYIYIYYGHHVSK